VKKYKGIRYGYRPKSYWSESSPLDAILRNVTGENRRRIIKASWLAGDIENIDPEILRDELEGEVRTGLGRIHPSFLGGEFLPPYLPGEVEIARILLKSTTSDVISLRARPVPNRIRYRIVDEYSGKFWLPITYSEKPLTLGELVTQFEEGTLDELPGNLAIGYNEYNAEYEARETLRKFTTIESILYRQLEEHFENVYEAWAATIDD
jgi:hypothetical protein